MSESINRLAGTAYIYIDGVQYPLVAEPTWGVAKKTRQTLTGMDRVHGFSETPKAGFIAATLRDERNTNVGDFEDMVDVSVTLELASGKHVSGSGMWTVEAVEVNSTEATYSIRFEGEDVEET